MLRQQLNRKKLPSTPGVYFFLGPKRDILYIGRATSLKDRVKSYFNPDLRETRGQQIVDMVAKAKTIDFRKTDSVLEAIILEADLIKKFQPKYNTLEKDDKSFNCVVITKEEFPRVLIIRKRDLASFMIPNSKFMIQASFGPYTAGAHLKEAFKIVRRILPFRDDKCTPLQGKPCFNRQIGLCPGVCTGEISAKDYAKQIKNISLFFSGKKTQILKNLNKDMLEFAKEKSFEKAAEIKKTIFALKHIQDISLISNSEIKTGATNSFRIEAYDVAHISGTDVVGVMVVVEDGLPVKSEYRKFKIRGGFGNNDTASLNEVIDRRLNHREWNLPTLIVADGNVAQKSIIEEAVRRANLKIPVVAVTKNQYHRPDKILGDEVLAKTHEKAILLANSEAHRFAVTFHRKRRGLGFLNTQ